MKLIHMTGTLSSFLLMLGGLQSFAGGAAAAPTVEYTPMVHCQAVNATESPIETLTYFVRTESQWGATSKTAGLHLEGREMNMTVYSLEREVHDIQNPQDQPQSLVLAKGKFYALGGNLRGLQAIAAGTKLSLSLVAGATGDVKIKNLEMVCATP